MSDERQPPLLFAYDGSECSKRAIAEGGHLLKPGSAVVLTVAAPAPPAGIGSGPALDTLDENVEDETLEIAAEGVKLASDLGYDARPEVIRADPVWEGVIEHAESIDATAIVMGTKGRTGLASVLVGSVAKAVVQRSARPVIVVP